MESPLRKMDSKISDSFSWQSHLGPEKSKWLAGNIKEMDQTAKQMLKLIEENNESEMVKDQMSHLNKTELIASVEDFYRIYRSLAQGYDNLSKELCTSVALEVQKQDLETAEPGADNSSTMVTPNEKIRPLKSGHQSAYFSCGGGSSDLSVQGTESFSTSSDSDSESFNSSVLNYLSSPVGNDSKGLNLKVFESEAEFPDMKDNLQETDKELAAGILKVEEQGNHQYTIDRLKKYEEELRVTQFKLQLAEEEVLNLKIELESNESVLAMAGSLNTQLESSQSVLKTREADLEMERRRTHELQKQVAELESQVLDSKSEINRLMEELEVSRDMLKGLSAEISKLNHELNSERTQVIDLEETIVSYKAYLSDRDHHVDELKTALCDVERNFSSENATLQLDVTTLSAKLKEWESLNASLEDKITKCNADKTETKLLHETEKVGLQNEVNDLKADLAVRGEHVEMLNKNLDKLSVRYDMVMSEKDECNAKIDKLVADLRSRDIQMGEMKNNLIQLNGKHKELISGFENSTKHVEELRVRVEELEKEVEKQRNEIEDGADRKREAIRQLCLTLDHYKSGYRQLCQAFPGHKRHAVIAS